MDSCRVGNIYSANFTVKFPLCRKRKMGLAVLRPTCPLSPLYALWPDFFVWFIVTLWSLFRHYLTRIWTIFRISLSYFISLLSCYSSKLFVTRVILTGTSLLRFSIVDSSPRRSVILIHWSPCIVIICVFYPVLLSPCIFPKSDLPFLFSVSFLYTYKTIHPLVTFSLLLLMMARRRWNFVFETRKYLIFVSTYREAKFCAFNE